MFRFFFFNPFGYPKEVKYWIKSCFLLLSEKDEPVMLILDSQKMKKNKIFYTKKCVKNVMRVKKKYKFIFLQQLLWFLFPSLGR